MTLFPSDQDLANKRFFEDEKLDKQFQKRNGKSIVDSFADGLANGLANGWKWSDDPDEARDFLEGN